MINLVKIKFILINYKLMTGAKLNCV